MHPSCCNLRNQITNYISRQYLIEEILPSLDKLSCQSRRNARRYISYRCDHTVGAKAKAEIEKAVLEKEIYASEYYPDVKVGLELKKYDLYDNDPDFEILATLTSKMTLFDGFQTPILCQQ